MSFGTWLKANRKKQGFTQEGLAKAANDICTGSYISSLERNQDVGKRGQPTTPSKDIVDALADALGRPRDEARLAAGYAPDKIENEDAPALYRTVDPKDQMMFNLERFVRLGSQFEELTLEEQEEYSRLLNPIAENIERRVKRRKK